MDGNQRFWLGIWAVGAAVFITLAVCITVSHNLSNYRLANSADPVALACAMNERPGIYCVAYMGGKH